MDTINLILFFKNKLNGKGKNIALRCGDTETTRDHAEILKLEFDNEIMSEHLGNSWYLSIKVINIRWCYNC